MTSSGYILDVEGHRISLVAVSQTLHLRGDLDDDGETSDVHFTLQHSCPLPLLSSPVDSGGKSSTDELYLLKV